MSLTAEAVRKLLNYSSETGEFRWKARPDVSNFASTRAHAIWNTRYAGRIAGSIAVVGYVTIRVIDRAYLAHRLAWLYVHGQWPAGEIDHINGDKLDNRLSNLRDVSGQTNHENVRTRPTNASALPLGVHFLTRKVTKPFSASIRLDGRSKHLGYFDTADQAHAAYVAMKRKAHVGCTI